MVDRLESDPDSLALWDEERDRAINLLHSRRFAKFLIERP
jgi:hypothetical protein